MEMHDLTVIQYEDKYEAEWDEFVMKEAINGTFLQTRRFLNYHAPGKFNDASVLVYDRQCLVAVCPACERREGQNKVLISHLGSTYGGILLCRKWYKVQRVIEIIETLEKKWREEKFYKVMLKQTPDIFSKEKGALLDYCFYYLNYKSFRELNFYVDFDDYNENILSELAQGKRTNVHNCEKEGLVCRKIETQKDIELFYALLEMTLQKHDKTPVHTVGEICDFCNTRLRDECELFGIYQDNEMLAGAMMFYFNNVRVAHTQYLCADSQYNKLSPMTFLQYTVLCEMRRRKFKKVSWGIATEENGKYLNAGLAKSKEGFGGKYDINVTYEKMLV